MEDNYNDIPVFYCKHCMSLGIKEMAGTEGYCINCGSTDIGEVDFNEYTSLYRKRFGKDLNSVNFKK